MDCSALLESRYHQTVDLRRRLHRIPELAYQEFKTAAAIREELSTLKIPYIKDVAGAMTATVAWIGNPNKPCVALRADIDALPILENTGVEYCSTHTGNMHACGHDGHMAMLCGTAAALKAIENELSVCVKLIFQPAEEGGGGANVLVQAGVLDGRIGPRVGAIFGLHGWPGLSVGMVSTKPGPLLAAVDFAQIEFVGRGCHGAYPHMGRDPIVTACDAVVNLQQFVSRDMDPTDPAVLTVGKISAGTAVNVIPDRAVMEMTIRTLTDHARDVAEHSIRRRCEGIAAANDCGVKIHYERGYPSTINDPQMTDYVREVAVRTFGADRYLPASRASMGGEDFSYYLQKVPGCFFLIGVSPPHLDDCPPLHSDRFDFTDAAMMVGMRMFVELVRNYRGA